MSTSFKVELDEPQTTPELALLPQKIYDGLESEGGDKVLTVGNETIPLNDTGTVIGITEFFTPDGRSLSGDTNNTNEGKFEAWIPIPKLFICIALTHLP